MGNDASKIKSKKEILDYIRSDIYHKKIIENRFLQRNVKKSDLTTEELEILKCLSKPEKAYYCGYCSSFPLIKFKSIPKKAIGLYLLEHNWGKKRRDDYPSHYFEDKKLSHSLNIYYRNYIEEKRIMYLIKDKYIKNTNDDLLPFESLEDFHEYLKVVIRYKALKEKILYYNLDNTEKNTAFTFFEFLLNIGLYGFGTLYEYLNALSIYDFLTLDAIGHLNCGQNMDNGDIIYHSVNFSLKQVINIKKLNDNNLIAYIIDANYPFSKYKEANCSILLMQFDIGTIGYNSYYEYLQYKENDKPSKNRIIKYDNFSYKDIIELRKDKYLLLLENNYRLPNLVIADLIKNTEKYDYKLIDDIICISFLKLKSNQIFMICKTNIILMEYVDNELKTKKSFDYEIEIDKNILYYELLNGDIIFNIMPNKFCYFNIKSFSIQTIIEIKQNEIINRFTQLNDKNYFYFFSDNMGYKLNITNGKIIKIFGLNDYTKEISKTLGDYYINYYNDRMNIITKDNKNIYKTEFGIKIKDILIVDKKEKTFITFSFSNVSYSMYIDFFKIKKNEIKYNNK